MDIVTKKDLSDNYGKPVYYFTKFFPEGYKPPKNIMKRTANEEYQGSIFFSKETANRILGKRVYILLSIYSATASVTISIGTIASISK